MAEPILLALDPTEPGLDHHRAGGHPLFGTAMGLAALIRAAVRIMPEAHALEHAHIYQPYLLEDGGPHRIALQFDPPLLDRHGRHMAGRVLRAHPRLPEMLLFDAIFRAAVPPPAPPQVAPAAMALGGVTAADIYRVYFHGPAFQVIEAGRLHGAAMVTRLSAAPALIPTEARLIEFAMQSAGLLELATSGRLMIPHRIGGVAPLLDQVAGPLYAIARYTGRQLGPITVAVTDAAGAVVMTLAAYETVELPFAIDPTTAAVLTERLRGTASKR